MWMFVKPCLDEGVEFRDLLVEGHHRLGEADHHGGGQLLTGQRSVLRLGGLHHGASECGGAFDLAVLQAGPDALHTCAAEGCRSLIARQQQHRALVGQVQ
ncbi:hypothetical protein ADL25_42570 [Streptomyces sp. NRRL F-5122]|nr:hypothetical protein ADL25_42570 [Streptomyces sp. NRRL F-5122]